VFSDFDLLYKNELMMNLQLVMRLFGIFSLRLRKRSINSAPGQKLPSLSCSATVTSYKGYKIFAIWQAVEPLLAICYCASIETGIGELLLEENWTTFDPATSVSYNTCVLHYRHRMTFAAYALRFCAQFSRDLLTLTFDLLTLTVSHILFHISNLHFSIIRLSVMDDSIWSHFHHTKRSLRMRNVTWSIYSSINKKLTYLLSPMPVLFGFNLNFLFRLFWSCHVILKCYLLLQ